MRYVALLIIMLQKSSQVVRSRFTHAEIIQWGGGNPLFVVDIKSAWEQSGSRHLNRKRVSEGDEARLIII